jgi:hypothetical protein
MRLLIQCTNCGKQLTLGPRAGTTIMCPACGVVQRVPAYDLTSDISPGPQSGNGGGFAQQDPRSFTGGYQAWPAGGGGTAGPRPSLRSRLRRRHLIAFVLVVVISGLGIGAMYLARLLPSSPDHPTTNDNSASNSNGSSGSNTAGVPDQATWEQAHRQEILSLKAEAEQLTFDGKLTEAYQKYQQLEQLVAGRMMQDSTLRDVTNRAAAHQDEIYKLIIAQVQARAAAGATTQPTDPYPTRFNGFRGTPENPAAAGQSTSPETRPAAPTPANDLPPIPGGKLPAVPGSTTATPSPSPNAAVNSSASDSTAKPAKSIHRYLPGELASDGDVGSAVQRGVDFLLAKFKDGEIDDGLPPLTADHQAEDVLAVYALLNAASASSDPRLDVHGPLMQSALERIKQFQFNSQQDILQAPLTYGRSLRAAALAIHNRPEDRGVLQADVRWLVHAATDGAYTYDDKLSGLLSRPSRGNGPRARIGNLEIGLDADTHADVRLAADVRTDQQQQFDPRAPLPRAPGDNSGLPPPIFDRQLRGYSSQDDDQVLRIWDNSNSQYGVLGVAAGADAGIDVPSTYWRDVEKHWTESQLNTGEWTYSAEHKTGSLAMTCGGIASLLAVGEHEDVPGFYTRLNAPPFSPSAGMGLGWLEQGDNAVDVYNPKTVYLGYNLFVIERVALMTGFKHFAKHDWYGELAAQAVVAQWPNGSWGRKDEGTGTVVDTSFVVTFLSRGRAPLLMNKLRFGPVWDNRPRDLANLSRYVSHSLERPINWQAVGFDRDWLTWTDAPILYIASHVPPKLEDQDLAKLKSYVDAGGILFTHADANSESFDHWAMDLASKLWPQYAMADLPPQHPLYTLVERLDPTTDAGALPKLKAVSNGVRLLMVESPTDLAASWQQPDDPTKHAAFAIGLNLFGYATGKATPRNKLEPFGVPLPPPHPGAMGVTVARLTYTGGDCDPEPGAWRRLARIYETETATPVNLTNVELTALKPGTAPVADLTGVGAHEFTDAEAAAVRDYVTSGGTLLIDACGGAGEFAASVQNGLLPRAFPGMTLAPLSPGDPMFKPTLPGMADVSTPRPRTGVDSADLRLHTLSAGRGRVIFSALDLTSGLLGTHTYGIVGYDPDYATAVVKNLLVLAATPRMP